MRKIRESKETIRKKNLLFFNDGATNFDRETKLGDVRTIEGINVFFVDSQRISQPKKHHFHKLKTEN